MSDPGRGAHAPKTRQFPTPTGIGTVMGAVVQRTDPVTPTLHSPTTASSATDRIATRDPGYSEPVVDHRQDSGVADCR